MDTLMDLLAVFGRMHPMVLHLPIGLLIGLALMELVGWKRGAAPVSRWLLVFATSTAVIAAASGWMLHEEDGYASSFALEWHERLGIGIAFVTLACSFFRFRGSVKPYRLTLLLSAALLVPAGHFGAEMTHGKGFLLEPLEQEQAQDYVPMVLEELEEFGEGTATLASFEEHIAPLLGARCTKCHGRRKSKGELRLDSPEAILAGGENGAVLAANAEESEIYRRLLLPLEHDDHMPPEAKTQLTKAEVELLRLWLDAEAPFEEGFALLEGMAAPEASLEDEAPAVGAGEESLEGAYDPEHEEYLRNVDVLHSMQVHAEPVAPGSKQLAVSFVPIKKIAEDATVERLLLPLQDYLEVLVLADTLVTDRILDLVSGMPKLAELNLDSTSISDMGLAALHGHPSLERLLITRTHVTSGSTAVFESLPRLTHLYLWGAIFSPTEVEILRMQMPKVFIDFGDSFAAEPLEVEPELAFTSDAPLIDPPLDVPSPAGGSVSLVPINTRCPVSGKPIDPRFSVVHEGKVLGFCCPNCPKTFWEDPGSFPVE